jgi:hypothetical protein
MCVVVIGVRIKAQSPVPFADNTNPTLPVRPPALLGNGF